MDAHTLEYASEFAGTDTDNASDSYDSLTDSEIGQILAQEF